jgi:DNA (cytosine-5)-methyltransferase 1
VIRVASLCAGYGGLEMGLSAAGIDHELVWWSEIDPSACSVMSAHTNAPNLGDLCAITDPPRVDLVTAGWPCQSVSVAGRRLGRSDKRWIIDDVCRVARAAGARWLILENTPGLLTCEDGDSLGAVCAAMAREGFRRWEWTTLRASDVGACHQRKRWFCVAEAPDAQDVGRGAGGDWRRYKGDQSQGGRRSNLVDAADYLALLPTPTAGNPNDGEDLGSWEARRLRNLAKGYNGNGQGTPLAIAVQLMPTPTARDWKGENQRRDETCPPGAVRALLPTPTAQDANSSGSAGYAKTATRNPGVTLTDALVRRLGPISQPSTGGPPCWDDLPQLRLWVDD